MEKLLLAVIIVFAFGTMAIASDIAFYVGTVQPGLYDKKTMTNDVEKIIKDAGALFNDIQTFDDRDLDGLGRWADANMGDGHLDIIWLNGQMPSTLYPTGNKAPNGSRAEEWLDDGNIVIAVQDWFAWANYETGEKQRNTHLAAGFIMDLSHDIILQAPDAPMHKTAAGRQYMPSVENGLLCNRPGYRGEVVDPWIAVGFAATEGEQRVDAGDREGEMIPAGDLMDPVVFCNTETSGCVATISMNRPENIPQGVTYRGTIISEFINNWVFGGGHATSVEAADKLAVTWGSIKG